MLYLHIYPSCGDKHSDQLGPLNEEDGPIPNH